MSDDERPELELDLPGTEAQPPEQDSAADPERPRRLKRQKKDEAREALQFWHDVFSSEVGRREMWKILSVFHPFDARLSATQFGFPNERETWMFLAEQIRGQQLYQRWFALFPQFVLQMQQENDPKYREPVKL